MALLSEHSPGDTPTRRPPDDVTGVRDTPGHAVEAAGSAGAGEEPVRGRGAAAGGRADADEGTAGGSKGPADRGDSRDVAAASTATGIAGFLLRVYPALSVPAFRVLWLGMLPATLAWQIGTVTTGYVAFVLSGSATVLGLVSLAVGLPLLVFALAGGVIADRLPRRTVLIVTVGVMALTAAAFALLSLGGWLDVWHLIAIGLVQGAMLAFYVPARQALAAEVVGRPLLRNAVALQNAGMNGCRIVGPALGGVLLSIPAIGATGAFACMTVAYLVVFASLVGLVTPPPASEDAERERRGGLAQMIEGLRYIARSPTHLILLALGVVALTLGLPYISLMPLFAEEVFDVGAAGLGTLTASSGIGALLGSFAIASVANVSRPSLLQIGIGMLFGVALAGFALAPSFEIAVVMVVVVGFAGSVYSTLNNTLLIANTEPRLHGRVMSVYTLTFGLVPVASLPAAWLADQVGGPATVAGAGTIIAATLVGIALLYPPARRIR